MSAPLKSIEEERKACEDAFRASPDAKCAWCCHHIGVCAEELTGNWQKRVDFISLNKPESELATRFRSFRPIRLPEAEKLIVKVIENHTYTKVGVSVVSGYSIITSTSTELARLLDLDWPDNTWDKQNNRVKGT